MPDVVAVIPVREGSQRVKNKNFRPFADFPNLLSLKIEHLKAAGCFEKIYVSSNSDLAKIIADKNKVDFLIRDSEMCSNDVRWSAVIRHVAKTVPGDPIISWVHTTSPLHVNYQDPVNTFINSGDQFDSLVTVNKVQEFLIKQVGRPFNYSWGFWHDYAQDLEPLYRVTGALFIAHKSDIIEWGYLIGKNPLLYEVSKLESIDVDEEDDFNLAEMIHQLKHQKKDKANEE